MAKRRKQVWQNHHIFYETIKEGNKRPSQKELIVRLKSYEHRIVSMIQQLKPETISREFWQAIGVYKAAYEPLSRPNKELENGTE